MLRSASEVNRWTMSTACTWRLRFCGYVLCSDICPREYCCTLHGVSWGCVVQGRVCPCGRPLCGMASRMSPRRTRHSRSRTRSKRPGIAWARQAKLIGSSTPRCQSICSLENVAWARLTGDSAFWAPVLFCFGEAAVMCIFSAWVGLAMPKWDAVCATTWSHAVENVWVRAQPFETTHKRVSTPSGTPMGLAVFMQCCHRRPLGAQLLSSCT